MTQLALDPWMIVFFALGLMLLYWLGKQLIFPLRRVFIWIVRFIFGAILLAFLHCFFFPVPITLVNAALIGFFGMPGLLLVFFLQLIF